VDRLQPGSGVSRHDCVDQCPDRLFVGCPQNGLGEFERQRLAEIADQLVEQADRVTHRAGGLPRDQFQGGLLELDSLVLQDDAEVMRDFGQGQPPEIKTLAARLDRLRHLVKFGRRQDEDRVFGRFLDCFQQRIERRPRKTVNLVDDVDFVAPLVGRKGNPVAQLADIVHPGM